MEVSKKDSFSHEKRSKSGFSSLKKKFNIPKIYKRLASKLSVHGRHIRSLTNPWNASDLQCLVSQYELTEMLKELSDTAELARKLCQQVSEDLLNLQHDNVLCDLTLSCNCINPEGDPVTLTNIQTHSILFAKRTGILLDGCKTAQLNRFPFGPATSTDYCSSTILDGCPFDLEYEYDEVGRNLKFTSNSPAVPNTFLKDMVSYVYGRDTEFTKSGCCNLSSFDSVGEEKQSKSAKCAASESKLAFIVGEQQKDSDFNGKLFFDDFRTDMKNLLLSANTTGDLILTSRASRSSSSWNPGSVACHSFVLAARSKFFRKAIQRHKEHNIASSNDKPIMTLILDTVDFRYFRTLLYAMYTDELDLQRLHSSLALTCRRKAANSTLSFEVQDLMELLFIGKSIEFPFLVQACESTLLDHLTAVNFIEMLQWSSKPHASLWLRRQVIRFAKENFPQLLANGSLYSLSLSELAEVIASDFVNASELDILRGVLKWGENELLRRVDLREPNVLRAHALPNQGTRNFRVSSRRRELVMAMNNEELHDITSALLPFVRLRHILPSNHEVLTNAMKRGVISSPPQHLLEWSNHAGVDGIESTLFWIRSKAGPEFALPRLFSPYYAEAKAILKERLCQEVDENVSLRSVRRTSSTSSASSGTMSRSVVPDALYMVNQVRHMTRPSSIRASYCERCPVVRGRVKSMATKRLKYINNTYPVPAPSVASSLLARERRLRQCGWVKKILQSCYSVSFSASHCCCNSGRNSYAEAIGVNVENPNLCNLCRAESYIRLIVVREHELPDVLEDVLKRPHLYYDADELQAASLAASTNQEALKSSVGDQLIANSSNQLEKFFHQKSLKRLTPVPFTASSLERDVPAYDSGSDLSLSDDSSPEWPFPYRSVKMRDRTLPGSSFWDSDSSVRTPPMRSIVPDVAASADSTLKTLRSYLSTSSSSDSCSSVPCRLVAESRPADEVIDRESTSRLFYTRQNSLTRPAAPSFARYLSLRDPSASRRRARATLSKVHSDRTLNTSDPEITSGPAPLSSNLFGKTTQLHKCDSSEQDANSSQAASSNNPIEISRQPHVFESGLKEYDLPETYT